MVATPGEIDPSNAAEFRQSLLSCANGGHPTVVVDMSETVFCDSTGLHQLVRARSRAIAAGGEVRLVVQATPVLRLFTIMGIDRLFPMFATLAEAVAGVAGAPAPGPGPQPPSPEHTQAGPALG